MSRRHSTFCPGCEKNLPPQSFKKHPHLCNMCSKLKTPEEYFTDPQPSTLIEDVKKQIEEEDDVLVIPPCDSH